MDFSEPPVQLVNDGWENNPVNPPSGVAQWLDNSPPPPHTTPLIASTASMAHSPPKYYRVLPHDHKINKGRKLVTSPSIEASQSSLVYSKQQSTKEDNCKREITFSDKHPETIKLEEKKSYCEYFLNFRPAVSEGRKERE
jgi:hypothetical protein